MNDYFSVRKCSFACECDIALRQYRTRSNGILNKLDVLCHKATVGTLLTTYEYMWTSPTTSHMLKKMVIMIQYYTQWKNLCSIYGTIACNWEQWFKSVRIWKLSPISQLETEIFCSVCHRLIWVHTAQWFRLTLLESFLYVIFEAKSHNQSFQCQRLVRAWRGLAYMCTVVCSV